MQTLARKSADHARDKFKQRGECKGQIQGANSREGQVHRTKTLKES